MFVFVNFIGDKVTIMMKTFLHTIFKWVHFLSTISSVFVSVFVCVHLVVFVTVLVPLLTKARFPDPIAFGASGSGSLAYFCYTPHPSDQLTERTHVCTTALQRYEDTEIKIDLMAH